MDLTDLQNRAEQSPHCKPIGCQAMSCASRMTDPDECNRLLNSYRNCIENQKKIILEAYSNDPKNKSTNQKK